MGAMKMTKASNLTSVSIWRLCQPDENSKDEKWLLWIYILNTEVPNPKNTISTLKEACDFSPHLPG